MGAQLDALETLNGKAAGQLIRSADWNALVTAVASLQTQVDALSASVDERFNTVNQVVAGLTSNVNSLTGRVTAVEQTLGKYFRITLATSQSIYALGEIAVLTIQVTDLAGQPLAFDAQSRPWITFLASWGRLMADTGFDVLGGFGDRSISVRTDAKGLCRVRLQPDHVEGFTLEAENEVNRAITATVPASNKTFADLIRASETPVTMKATGAFSLVTTEYERTDAVHMRNFVDTYYEKDPRPIIGRVIPAPLTWRDYRASVVCFATVGSDPHAGDFTRGSGSIAIDFRDWIAPWFNLEYTANTTTLVANYRDRLAPKFTANLDESVDLIKKEVGTITAGGGLLKQRRDYDAIGKALDQVNIAQPPAFLNAVTASVKSAIDLQQTVSTGANSAATSNGVAFNVFTHAATRGDASVAGVNSSIDAVQQQVVQFQKNVSDVSKQVSTLQLNLTASGAKLDAALAEGGIIHNVQADVNTVKSQVGTLQLLNLNPTEIKTRLDTVAGLENRVGMLELKK